MSECYVCGSPVPLGDDTLALHYLVNHGMLPVRESYFIWGTKHIIARADCPGSPSRAQYLPGQPLDVRGYYECYEPRVRAAYKRLMELETIQHLNGKRG